MPRTEVLIGVGMSYATKKNKIEKQRTPRSFRCPCSWFSLIANTTPSRREAIGVYRAPNGLSARQVPWETRLYYTHRRRMRSSLGPTLRMNERVYEWVYEGNEERKRISSASLLIFYYLRPFHIFFSGTRPSSIAIVIRVVGTCSPLVWNGSSHRK